MIKKTIKELNYEDFYKYGSYSSMLSPKGIKFGNEQIGFYRDMIQLDIGQTGTVSFSLCRIVKRELIIDCSEYHNYTGEMIMPIDGDILMHVGPAIDSDKVPVNDIEIYRIPKGTVVCIRPGVWHQAAFTHNCDEVNILVALPERTYNNDCHLIKLDAEEQIEIKI
jgi:ureidoglycolate lyase